MLNMNSPTVQMMLRNTPEGFGNMPVYYGSAPTITTEIVTPGQMQGQNDINVQQQPFPSPKQMIIQNGQNTIYNPTSFQPRNVVGGYNQGYQAAFAGYSNPFMGYGYSGYGNVMYPNNYGNQGYMYNSGYGNVMYPNKYGHLMAEFVSPPDEDSRQRLEAAYDNGYVNKCDGDLIKAYDMQLVTESELYKKISRTVSKNLGRSEKEAKECEEAFSIYNKYRRTDEEEFKRKPIKIHIQLKIGDRVVADLDPKSNIDKMNSKRYQFVSPATIEYCKVRNAMIEAANINKCNQLYENAPERKFDKVDLYDFFNYGAGVIMADSLNRDLYAQRMKNIGKVYNGEQFRQLLVSNGLRTEKQDQLVGKFVGRYGIMPDGRPVSPSHDPAIATCFSYDPKTGQYSVTAPNFIRDRFERARDSFIKSVD